MVACEEKRFKMIMADRLFRCLAPAVNVPIREALTMLAELSFKIVPPRVMELARTAFASFGASLVNEKGFKSIADRLTQQFNKA